MHVEFANLHNNLPRDYLFDYEVYFSQFLNQLNVLLAIKYEDKLEELAPKYKSLSITDQNQVDEIEFQIDQISSTLNCFWSFCNKVGLRNNAPSFVKEASNKHSEIFIIFQKWKYDY